MYRIWWNGLKCLYDTTEKEKKHFCFFSCVNAAAGMAARWYPDGGQCLIILGQTRFFRCQIADLSTGSQYNMYYICGRAHWNGGLVAGGRDRGYRKGNQIAFGCLICGRWIRRHTDRPTRQTHCHQSKNKEQETRHSKDTIRRAIMFIWMILCACVCLLSWNVLCAFCVCDRSK